MIYIVIIINILKGEESKLINFNLNVALTPIFARTRKKDHKVSCSFRRDFEMIYSYVSKTARSLFAFHQSFLFCYVYYLTFGAFCRFVIT